MSTTTWPPGRAVPNPAVRRRRRAFVALDGSAASISALIWLIEYGHLQQGELRLVTVEAGAERALAAAPDVTRRHRIWLDDAARYAVAGASPDGIADAVARLAGPGDMIVVGAKPAALAPGQQAASLADSLATRSPVPTVVVPEERPSRSAGTVHLIVEERDAQDGRDQSDGPLRYAAAEALRRTVPLHLLHGWHAAPTREFERTDQSAAHDARRRSAHATVDTVQRQVEAAYPTLHVWCRVVEGPAPGVLLPHLHRAGLAVVGRPESAAREQTVRSVALDLVAALPCPVTVVPLDRRHLER